MAELKPCPFCGWSAKAGVMTFDGKDGGGHFVACTGCGASTNLRFACGDDPAAPQAEAWNRRAAPQHGAEGLASFRNAQALAKRFHEAYERLAPSFGYETRPETRAFDPQSANGRLMVAVCQELFAFLPTSPALNARTADLMNDPARPAMSMFASADDYNAAMDKWLAAAPSQPPMPMLPDEKEAAKAGRPAWNHYGHSTSGIEPNDTYGMQAAKAEGAGGDGVVKECGTCFHKATLLGHGPCRGCRYSGYPNWRPENTLPSAAPVSPKSDGGQHG